MEPSCRTTRPANPPTTRTTGEPRTPKTCRTHMRTPATHLPRLERCAPRRAAADPVAAATVQVPRRVWRQQHTIARVQNSAEAVRLPQLDNGVLGWAHASVEGTLPLDHALAQRGHHGLQTADILPHEGRSTSGIDAPTRGVHFVAADVDEPVHAAGLSHMRHPTNAIQPAGRLARTHRASSQPPPSTSRQPVHT